MCWRGDELKSAPSQRESGLSRPRITLSREHLQGEEYRAVSAGASRHGRGGCRVSRRGCCAGRDDARGGLGVVASSRPPTATPRESPGPAARRLCRIAFRCLSRGLADPTDFSLRADARPYGLSALGSVGADVWMAQPAGSSIRQEFRTARRAGSVLSGVRLRECRLSWVRRHRTCPRSRQGYSAEGLPRPRFRRSGREVRASPWPRLPRRAGSRG